MNWSAWAPAIITVIGWIFTMGLTVGRINDQEKTLEDHHERLGEHTNKLESHAIAIAEGKAWREGYNSAAKKHEVRS